MEQALLDLRKRKRMMSNRESARRSRLRKRQRSEDLEKLAAELREANSRISNQVRLIGERCGRVQAENLVIRVQATELRERLRSVNSLLGLIAAAANGGMCLDTRENNLEEIGDRNSWEMDFPAVPIATDVFQW